MQPEQASHISKSEQFVLSDGNSEAWTSFQQHSMPMEIQEVNFAPYEPVAPSHSTAHTIISIGTGYKRTKRGQTGDRMKQQLLLRVAAMERGAQATQRMSLARRKTFEFKGRLLFCTQHPSWLANSKSVSLKMMRVVVR